MIKKLYIPISYSCTPSVIVSHVYMVANSHDCYGTFLIPPPFIVIILINAAEHSRYRSTN